MASDRIGLYVHWPYCTRICPYCDFNIYKARVGSDVGLTDAIIKDICATANRIDACTLTSIHFGGGTPSLMSTNDMARIIETATNALPRDANLEIGLEANPNDINRDILVSWSEIGINRLSIGVQSFDGEVLKVLGRTHDGDQARQALALALDIMPRVSCDLIFGLNGQSLGQWQSDIETALQTGVGHISAYQLTIKPGTAFERARMRGHDKAVGGDDSADFYGCVTTALRAAGFSHYEVSNFAKTKADRSIHNLLYWQGAAYIGVGPGAHGRISVGGVRRATVCDAKPNDYMDRVAQTGFGLSQDEALSPADIADEYVLMGLRCAEGISEARYKTLSGGGLNQAALNDHLSMGHLVRDGERIRPTEAGYVLLDAVSFALLS